MEASKREVAEFIKGLFSGKKNKNKGAHGHKSGVSKLARQIKRRNERNRFWEDLK